MELDLGILEHVQKWFRVLAIVIVHHDFAWQVLLLSVLDERLGLLDHPSLIWFVSRRCDVYLSRFDIEKDSNKDVSKSRFRNDLLREEIALPHGFRVTFQDFAPRSRATSRTGFIAVTFQDIFDRVSRHGLDAQFSQFAKDASVAPRIIFGEFQDQLFNLLCSPRSAVLSRPRPFLFR